jgi:hypothetical protein
MIRPKLRMTADFARGIHRTGTKGSNPVPSTSESANPRSLWEAQMMRCVAPRHRDHAVRRTGKLTRTVLPKAKAYS